MSFGDAKAQAKASSPIKRIPFLKLIQGISANIRILGDERLDFTHYVNGSTVACLGKECPICTNNARLVMEYPKTFRNESAYSARAKKYSVNVLDKTMVKKCECGLEYSDPSVATCTCGKILTKPMELSNTVKVLSKGPKLFDVLFALHDAVLDENHDRVGITNFDITLVTSGTGKETVVTPIPNPMAKEPTPEGLELHDLSKVVIRLDPAEMLDLQRGISLKDIFAARKASSPVDTTVVSDEVAASVKDEVDALFASPDIE